MYPPRREEGEWYTYQNQRLEENLGEKVVQRRESLLKIVLGVLIYEGLGTKAQRDLAHHIQYIGRGVPRR